ncbi:MAG: hypothetical protein ACYSO7_02550 [Planctomycetota bacterium]|jgi:hypothetical protein
MLSHFDELLDLFGNNIESYITNSGCQSRIDGVFTAQTVHECEPVAMAGCIVLEPTCHFSE